MIGTLRDGAAQPLHATPGPSRVVKYIQVNDSAGSDTSRLNGTADGLDAVRQAVAHIVGTERYAYAIYDSGYGIELEQFKGGSFNYFRAKIEQVFRDALLRDDRVTDVRLISTAHPAPTQAYARFEIVTVFGAYREDYIIRSE